jgi:hypothetical protein
MPCFFQVNAQRLGMVDELATTEAKRQTPARKEKKFGGEISTQKDDDHADAVCGRPRPGRQEPRRSSPKWQSDEHFFFVFVFVFRRFRFFSFDAFDI